MSKVKKHLLLLVTLFALLVPLATTTSAHAATWHYGIPSALRGTWWAHHDKVFHTHYVFGRNYMHGYSNDPNFLNNTKYQKLHKGFYKVNGYEPYYSKKRGNTYILRKGKHITFYELYKGKYNHYIGNFYKNKTRTQSDSNCRLRSCFIYLVF